MRRALAWVAVWIAPSLALAQDGGPRPSAPDAGAHAAALPAGADTSQLPHGHPAVAADDAQDAPPPSDGVFHPPPDETTEDDNLPRGTIVVGIYDARNEPMSDVGVTLGVIQQSVAKGESRKHLSGTTDRVGQALFSGLESGSGFAYRVSVAREGATFAAMPFQMNERQGMRVRLHVYPVVRDLKEAIVFFQGALFVDVKDDRVQIQQAFRVSNLSPKAWVPQDVAADLPEGFSAFNAAMAMSDQGFDATAKGVKLRGTFPPGESDLSYSWQLPYSGEKDVAFDVDLPPHMASLVVRAAASQDVKLVVDGFPPAEKDQDEQGNHLLVTGKQAKPDDSPMRRVRIAVKDLPTPGWGRWAATALAAFGVAVGLALWAQRDDKPKGAAKDRRAALLEELEALELARAEGEVGPKTYERARREIIDAIARTLEPKA